MAGPADDGSHARRGTHPSSGVTESGKEPVEASKSHTWVPVLSQAWQGADEGVGQYRRTGPIAPVLGPAPEGC